MEAHKEQLSPTVGISFTIFAVAATIFSYRVTQYTWLHYGQDGHGTTLGASDAKNLLPHPLLAEELPIPTTTSTSALPQAASHTYFQADPTVSWHQVQGKTYPYVFSIPDTLTLFPLAGNGPDTFGTSWNNEVKILIGISNLPNEAQSKKTYVENWWKQFSGFSGLVSAIEFVSAQGLKGYRATYSMKNGSTADSNIFFEIPGRPELIIRMTNSFIDQATFDRIVDSVGWIEPTVTPTSAPTSIPAPTNNPTATPVPQPSTTATPTPTDSIPSHTPTPTP